MGGGVRDRGVLALAVGFAVILLALIGAVGLFQLQRNAQQWVVHTLEVRDQLTLVLSRLQDAESGVRGYVVTGSTPFLDPYNDSRRALPGDLAGLRGQIADNPDQVRAAESLSRCTAARMQHLNSTLALVRAQGPLAAAEKIRRGESKTVMDRCRAIVLAMRETERRLFEQRREYVRLQTVLLDVWLGVSALVVIALAAFATFEARRRARAAEASRVALEVANDQLVAEGASRAAAEAQIRQMQKIESLGQLTGGIAHDFNNMLAIVIGSLDLARRRLAGEPERAAASIENALQGARRAAELTARLLAFSRQQPLAPRALDLNRLVGNMSELLRRTLGETVRFETVLAGGLWPAFIDAAQLESAIVNLCVNARDAMPEGGRLTLETANAHLDDTYAATHGEVAPGQYVLVSVTDTGSGMPPEVIERAFDPFFTTKEVGKGTGLGLSQVYGFVKQSGGHVKIYSEPGVGTTIKLYLRRHFGATEMVVGGTVVDEALPHARPDEIVLVVEDDARVRALSIEILRELGYLVLHAADGAEALEILHAQPAIRLLFTDVIMPDMNGRRLAEQARALRPDLKLLYTTGYTRNAIVHNGVLDHDVDFLPKPFTVQQLAVKVRQVLDA